jgi:hypothetical protein
LQLLPTGAPGHTPPHSGGSGCAPGPTRAVHTLCCGRPAAAGAAPIGVVREAPVLILGLVRSREALPKHTPPALLSFAHLVNNTHHIHTRTCTSIHLVPPQLYMQPGRVWAARATHQLPRHVRQRREGTPAPIRHRQPPPPLHAAPLLYMVPALYTHPAAAAARAARCRACKDVWVGQGGLGAPQAPRPALFKHAWRGWCQAPVPHRRCAGQQATNPC